jgi:hypothetical protein
MADCCKSIEMPIEKCGKVIIDFKNVVIDYSECSGRIIEVPVTVENVCCNIPLNVAVIVCKETTDGKEKENKVVGVLVKQLIAEKCDLKDPKCTSLFDLFCIPIKGTLCDVECGTKLVVKVIAAYALDGVDCPSCCDNDC